MQRQRLKNSKKGALDALGSIFISLIVLALIASVSFLILSELASNTSITADGNATAAVTQMQTSGQDVIGWTDIIIVVLIGSLLIGLVMFFRKRT